MHNKTGIIIRDFNALQRDETAFDKFISAVQGQGSEGYIVLSLTPTRALQTALRPHIPTTCLTDITVLSTARLSRLCTQIYTYDDGTLTLTPAHPPQTPTQARVGLFVSNGYGLGHVTRMRALAAMLTPHVPCAFLSLSAGLVDSAFYLPSPQYLELEREADARTYMFEPCARFITQFNPTHIVYDGNVIPDGLFAALKSRPDIHLTWMRRGMWPQNIAPTYMTPQALCDLVIEPGDMAADADIGPSWQTRLSYAPANQFLKTPPIRPIHETTLTASEAKSALGLTSHKPHALIMLGANQQLDDLTTLQTVVNAVSPTYIPVIAHWPMSHSTPPQIDGVITIEQMPLAPYYCAFELIISAAGYNSFHELLATDRPIIFVPQTNQGRDQQATRAQYAQTQGWAAICTRDNLASLKSILSNLSAQPRPNIAFMTDTCALLHAMGITPHTGGLHTHTPPSIPKSTLKRLHKRASHRPTQHNFVLATKATALNKLNPTTDIIITNTISPVALRRAGFKYLWLNAHSPMGQKRQFINWLKLWRPAKIKTA